ncbi:hypothetical protein [Limobrevibacterium gyesilva]|uniref:ATP-grasp domain-containing protein n=1 Tax=Limobrevibacterium gyesilva TaxID=2991712 RepID=A0AA41YL40_9PROT|nr:hypothetical protein [Limobrevibacterium gyesilva]MCW3475404.1 hypothetical protein [Limobrevibacterium gyesilva]
MRPRILLVALADWFGPTRLPRALREAGFEVGVLADPDGLLAQSSHIEYRFALSAGLVRLGVLRPVLRTILEFQPRIVVPCDEAAVHLLQNLANAWDGARGPGGQLRVPMPPLVREILLRSLGEARSFAARSSRPLARKLAATLGIAAPPSAPVPYLQVAEAFARDHGWPVVLTREGRTGGDRVRVCADQAELHAAYSDLTQPEDVPHWLGRAVRYPLWSVLTGFHLAGDLTRPLQDGPLLAIEAHVPGRPATYTVVAYDGRALAGIAAVAEVVHPPGTGASTVVRLVNDRTMADTSRKLVGRLGFTGFGGIDFVRDEASNKLWFLKFNARPTPLSHLGRLAGGDLCTALLAAVTNAFPVPQRATKETTVALFPQDWMRDPNAANRGADHVDLPVDDDRLFNRLKAMLPRTA